MLNNNIWDRLRGACDSGGAQLLNFSTKGTRFNRVLLMVQFSAK